MQQIMHNNHIYREILRIIIMKFGQCDELRIMHILKPPNSEIILLLCDMEWIELYKIFIGKEM